MNKKSLAVLIPVFNNQEGLLSSLDSLRGQIDFEHVFIVDDGSNPPIAISTSYPARLIKLEKNQGIVGALNAGLSVILHEKNYEYIARLDAGDICHSQRLELQQDYLLKNPLVGVLGTFVNFVSQSGEVKFKLEPPTCDADIRKSMFLNCVICHPTVMIRVDAIKSVCVYDKNFLYAEDYELFRRIMKKYQAANLPIHLVDSEINENGISISKRNLLLKSRMRVQRKYFEKKSIMAWYGVIQTLILSVVSNKLLLWVKQKRGKWS